MSNFTLTREQLLVLKKLASYYKISSKVLRDSVDTDSLDQGIFTVTEPYHCFRVVAGVFNLGDILTPKKFEKTQLYAAIRLFTNKDGGAVPIAYCSKGGIWVVTATVSESFSPPEGTGCICLNHECIKDLGFIEIMPIQNYLQAYYPLPLDD